LLEPENIEKTCKKSDEMIEGDVVSVGKHESPCAGEAQKEAENHTTRMRQSRRSGRWN
jgi:hypothetical protein